LPENVFVAAVRYSIPASAVRMTKISTRGNLRGRGRGRSCATRAPAKKKEPAKGKEVEENHAALEALKENCTRGYYQCCTRS
jgi:hypothetical protein